MLTCVFLVAVWRRQLGRVLLTCMTHAAGLLAWSMAVRHSQGQDSCMCSASGISSVATQLSINHITRHRDFLV